MAQEHEINGFPGASPKPDRYAFMALERLQRHGFKAVPVNPAFSEILGDKCFANIGDVPGLIDTVTVYLGEPRSTPLIDEIIGAKPRRIVFNPGAGKGGGEWMHARDTGGGDVVGRQQPKLTLPGKQTNLSI